MIKLIIFDLWDTVAYHKIKDGSLKSLCKECYVKNYRTFLKTYEQLFQTSKNVSYEKNFETLFRKLKVKFDSNLINLFVSKRRKYETEYYFYSYVDGLVKKLKKKGYKVVLLSNSGQFVGDQIKRTKLKKLFDKLFFSYELKAIKPSPKTYRAVLNYFKVKPSEAVMIGDNYNDDYLGSKKIGLNAVHFKNGRQLMKDLRGIKII